MRPQSTSKRSSKPLQSQSETNANSNERLICFGNSKHDGPMPIFEKIPQSLQLIMHRKMDCVNPNDTLRVGLLTLLPVTLLKAMHFVQRQEKKYKKELGQTYPFLLSLEDGL